jgi:hypothetical protein
MEGTIMKRSTAIVSAVATMGVGALLATGITGIASAGPGERGGGMYSSDSFRSHHGNGYGHQGHMGKRQAGTPVRGEHVVQDASGAFITYRMIQGTVTAVSSSSITVKAADDTTQIYAVNADTRVGQARSVATIADVSVGDTVHVMGKINGSTATADRIHKLA